MIRHRPTLSRKTCRLLILFIGLALPSAAWGQEAVDKLNRPEASPEPGQWIVQWAASAEPAFQIDRDQVADLDPRDVQDEGEYTVGATLKTSFPRLVELSFAPSVTISPHWFDEQDETSGWSVTAQVRRKIEFPHGSEAARRGLSVLPFANYKLGESFDGVFAGEETDDRTFAVGATWANVLCAAVGCVDDPALTDAFTISYSELDSSDDDKDARGPTLEVAWDRPAFSDTVVWLKASADFRTYDSLSADSGGAAAAAERYSVAVGLDVSGWARRLGVSEKAEVRIGVRWVRVDANRADLEREDFALIPTISWKR